MLRMEANDYAFLGLEADREACIVFRKSRLILASNFLVGIAFSASRFSLASILEHLLIVTEHEYDHS